MKKEALILSLCLLMAAPDGMVTMADAPAELEPAIMASVEPVEAQDQKKDADTEEGQPDFKERANAALHPEAAEETSTVQEGDLYIPKDTQIRLGAGGSHQLQEVKNRKHIQVEDHGGYHY